MRYLAVALLVGCHGASPSFEADAASPAGSCAWSAPSELTELSDSAVERDPTETADLLELYYTSDAAPGEILFAARTSADQPFVPQALPAFDDPLAVDGSPVVSADGLHAVFTSDRSGTVEVYESKRTSRTASWSAPQLAVRGDLGYDVAVGAGGIGMTADALTLVYQLSTQTSAYCFTRQATDQPFNGNCDDRFAMPSPAFDDAYTTVYYNCGTGICARQLVAWPQFKTAGNAEEHLATGIGGASDPWIEPGGDTILFAADHALFRTTRSCN